MDKKKVREAIELLKGGIRVLEKLKSNIDIIEKKKKKHIGLYNTAIEALEKQLPKKPIEHHQKFASIYECPSCGNIDVYGQKNCDDCGQKLDW